MYDFYWYPKCSTCRRAKAQLDSQSVSYQEIDMIKMPPSKEVLKKWMLDGKFECHRFFNTSGMKYRELKLKDKLPQMTIDEASRLLASDGMLIRRPLIVKNGELLQIGYKEAGYKEL